MFAEWTRAFLPLLWHSGMSRHTMHVGWGHYQPITAEDLIMSSVWEKVRAGQLSPLPNFLWLISCQVSGGQDIVIIIDQGGVTGNIGDFYRSWHIPFKLLILYYCSTSWNNGPLSPYRGGRVWLQGLQIPDEGTSWKGCFLQSGSLSTFSLHLIVVISGALPVMLGIMLCWRCLLLC